MTGVAGRALQNRSTAARATRGHWEHGQGSQRSAYRDPAIPALHDTLHTQGCRDARDPSAVCHTPYPQRQGSQHLMPYSTCSSTVPQGRAGGRTLCLNFCHIQGKVDHLRLTSSCKSTLSLENQNLLSMEKSLSKWQLPDFQTNLPCSAGKEGTLAPGEASICSEASFGF